MKITMICDVLGEANNGTTLAALNLIAHLREKGHQLTVVSPDAYRTEAGFVAVPELNLGFLLNKVLQKNGVHLAKPDKRILEQAIRGADVVHLLTPFPLAIAGLKIARRYGIPVTASFHCQAENVTAHLGLMNFRPANALTYRIFYKKVYRYCTAVHYPTDFIRGVFEKSVKHKTPAYVISNGVNNMFVPDPNAVRDPDAPFTIVCCGRYSKEKAQYQLIRALSHSRYADKIRVVFAGTGPWEKYLRFLAKRKGIAAQFSFFAREDLVKILQTADLYVHTALVEIEAIACTEAICCGLVPVICDSPRSATRLFAIGDHSLFRMLDPKNLCEMIEYWYENPGKKRQRSEEYEALRKKFAQRECMERMEQMLYEAAKRA